jgi:cytochrome c-type biogenesis protein
MPDLLLALFAGMLTIAAPCTLPVLPILLGASIVQRAGARPALIAVGFVVSFAFVALALNTVANALNFDPDWLRTVGFLLLIIFGVLMICPATSNGLRPVWRVPAARWCPSRQPKQISAASCSARLSA